MKEKPGNIILWICLLFLASISVSQAQDTSYPIPEEVIESEEVISPDYSSSSDDELRHKNGLSKDSLTRNQVYKPKSEKTSEKEADEESVLSFNFLYYIIQRFKMSELMEEEK